MTPIKIHNKSRQRYTGTVQNKKGTDKLPCQQWDLVEAWDPDWAGVSWTVCRPVAWLAGGSRWRWACRTARPAAAQPAPAASDRSDQPSHPPPPRPAPQSGTCHTHISTVYNQCCGSGNRGLFDPLDPGSRIRNRFFPDPGSQTHIFESLVTIFSLKSSIILWKSAQIFFFSISKKNNFQFCEICGYKKGVTTDFFTPLLLLFLDQGFEIRDPRSGLGKKSGSGIRINIPDPQHCIQLNKLQTCIDSQWWNFLSAEQCCGSMTFLVWIRIRGFVPLTNGSGSFYLHHYNSRRQQKTFFLK